MTFKRAYDTAMKKSVAFRRHDEAVKTAQANNEASACMIFSVEPGETFYYGFDGVNLQKGKHTRRRAQVLTDRNEVLIIL